MWKYKVCYICKEKFENEYEEGKKYHKARDYYHCTGEHRTVVHSICNLKYSLLNKIPIVFHNGSNYDYYFIIKK